jgi:hypothetical protein
LELLDMHLRCHTSTKVFDISDWLRLSRINDGVSKTFPLFVGHFVTQGASLKFPLSFPEMTLAPA